MVAVLFAGVYVFYLLAANLLIGTRVVRSMFHKRPDSLSVEYASAWTFWPGRVRVRELRIQDRGNSAEWSVTLDDGRGSIGLLDLLRRRFHCTRIRGVGLAIRVRSLVTPEEATEHRLAFIPKIPGYPDPPLRDPGRKRSSPTGREWTVELEDVAVDGLREIWVDDFRYGGGATLVGGMLLHPKHSFEMFPSSLAVHGGALTFRGDTVVASALGRLEARIHPYDVQVWKGSGVLRFMTGTGRVEGRIEGMRFLNELVHISPKLQLDEGTGTQVAQMSLDRGQGSGSVEFSAKGVRGRMPRAVMRGDAEGIWVLRHLDLAAGHADFSGSRIEVHDVLVHGGASGQRPWHARMDMLSGDLRTDRPRVFDMRLAVRADEARPIYEMLGLNLRSLTERVLKLEKLEAKIHVAIGETFLDLKSLEATGGSVRILGRYHYLKEPQTPGNGEFLVTAGFLALGVGIENGKPDYKFFRPRSWYRKQTATAGSATPPKAS